MREKGKQLTFTKTYMTIQILIYNSRDRMVVGFTITYMQSVFITTKVLSSDPTHGKVYLIQYYVMKFVSDLLQVDGFLHQ